MHKFLLLLSLGVLTAEHATRTYLTYTVNGIIAPRTDAELQQLRVIDFSFAKNKHGRSRSNSNSLMKRNVITLLGNFNYGTFIELQEYEAHIVCVFEHGSIELEQQNIGSGFHWKDLVSVQLWSQEESAALIRQAEQARQ